MESRNVRHLLQSAATGSFLLLSAAPVTAGHIFPEEPQRPHMTAAYLPNWGYSPTCWQRFPPVPPCDGASDCNNNGRPVYPDSDPSGSIYAPPSGLLLPDQNIYSQPASILPPSVGGSRYMVPAQSDLNSRGSDLLLPTPPVPSAFGDSLQPTPLAPSALPPLPSPPTGLSQPPGQTRFAPDRLMFTPDGRIVAAPAATSAYQATSSRYGGRSQAQPVLASGAQTAPSSQAMRHAGPPVHFASAPGQAVPAHAVSRGRSPINSAPSNRYGAPPAP